MISGRGPISSQTLAGLIDRAESHGERPAISWNGPDGRVTTTYAELIERARCLAAGLSASGIVKGDRVALFSRNCPRWLETSLGINLAGAIDVPRGENTSWEELNFIVDHSQAKAVIAEDRGFLDAVRSKPHDSVESWFTIEAAGSADRVDRLIELGGSRGGPPATGDDLSPDDTASIIYTSGTTALPKGVELTHGNLMSNLAGVSSRIKVGRDDRVLSILPAWHALERIVKYTALAGGAETFYTSAKTLQKDMYAERPTFMVSVPRIWEMVHSGLMKKIRDRGRFSSLVLKTCLALAANRAGRNPLSPIAMAEFPAAAAAELMVFKKLRELMGGSLRHAVSGGSSLPRHIDEFFHAAGIELIEGYGLTETSPVISARVPGLRSLSTVGPLLDGIEGRIVDPETGKDLPHGRIGILFVRGPNVMKGYFRNFVATSHVLHHDGWFDTGDLACFDRMGNLCIRGRGKDLIVLSTGENVNPLPIEEALRCSGYISAAIAVGHEWRQIGAIIEPDFDALEEFCRARKVKFRKGGGNPALKDPLVQNLYRAEVDRLVNSSLARGKPSDRIARFRIVSEPFRAGFEMTATLKPKRSVIEKKYKALIASLGDEIN